MSWFNANENLSRKAKKILEELAEQGCTEASAVAETLNDIASNGDESATDKALAECAHEIAGWARNAERRLTKKKKTKKNPAKKCRCTECGQRQGKNHSPECGKRVSGVNQVFAEDCEDEE